MRHRWIICSLLFAGATINYVDRQVLAVLKPTLQAQLGWSEIGYGDIVTAFQAAYAVGMLRRRALHRPRGRARRPRGDGGVLGARDDGPRRRERRARLLRGARRARSRRGGPVPRGRQGDRRVVPATRARLRDGPLQRGHERRPDRVPAARAVARRRRRLARHVRRPGRARARLGSCRGSRRFGRPSSTRASRPRRCSPCTPTARRDARLPWRALLRTARPGPSRSASSSPIPAWWLYLFWIPDFLHRNHGLDLQRLGPPLVAIYLLSLLRRRRPAGGSRRGSSSAAGTTNAARKTTMLLRRARRAAHPGRGARDLAVDGRGPHRPRRGRAPGVLGEPAHAAVGSLPSVVGGVHHGHRRHGRRHRRHRDRADGRTHSAGDGQLPRALRAWRRRRTCRARRHPAAVAAARARRRARARAGPP